MARVSHLLKYSEEQNDSEIFVEGYDEFLP